MITGIEQILIQYFSHIIFMKVLALYMLGFLTGVIFCTIIYFIAKK